MINIYFPFTNGIKTSFFWEANYLFLVNYIRWYYVFWNIVDMFYWNIYIITRMFIIFQRHINIYMTFAFFWLMVFQMSFNSYVFKHRCGYVLNNIKAKSCGIQSKWVFWTCDKLLFNSKFQLIKIYIIFYYLYSYYD